MRKLLIVAGLAAATAVPTAASAQSAWQQYNPFAAPARGADACYSQQQNARMKGALAGAAVGAVAGSQLAGNGARTEGAVLAGAIGAVGGQEFGRRSVNCAPAYAPQGAYGYRQPQPNGQPAYGYAQPAPQPYGYYPR